MNVFIALTAALSVWLTFAGSSPRLEGCPSADRIAAALEKLNQFDWSKVDSSKIREIWPGEVKLLGCDSTTRDSFSIGTHGRIIDGNCECCETFDFHYGQNNSDSRREHLANLIVKHKAARKEDAVRFARTLARAAGLSEAKVNVIGQEGKHHFQWEKPLQERFFSLEIEFTAHRGAWSVYLSLGNESLKE